MNTFPKIIDNNRKSLLEVFQQVASQYETLSIATGYWDLKGMQMIFEEIKNYKNIRILIGREPLIPRHKQKEPEPDYPDKDLFSDLERMQPTLELKELVKSIKEMIERGTLEVRVYRKNFLHAKCYIFGGYLSENAIGIIGSSNFTKNGLTANTELNALESDHRIVSFQPKSEKQEVGHLFWFDQFWNDSETEDWNGEFTELLGMSPVGDTLFSPYETYIKTLSELYREELVEEEYKPKAGGSYTLYEFQQKNVLSLRRKLRKHGVAMLSDSVGLGKTITALEVIKSYRSDQRRTVVICPKSLIPQWERELRKNDLSEVRPITLQNMEEIKKEQAFDRWAGVSLFVIDESHNLRKTSGERYLAIVDWIRNNPKAHVLLLTATPINNELSDIVNQILLGTRGMGDVFPVLMQVKGQEMQVPFVEAVERIQKELKRQAIEEERIDYEAIKQVMAPIIRQVVVRRTRQGIVRDYGGIRTAEGEILQFPKESVKKQGYSFPKTLTEDLLQKAKESKVIPDIFSYAPSDIAEQCSDFSHPLDQIQKLDILERKISMSIESPITILFQLLLFLGLVPYRWRMYHWKYYGKTVEEIKALRLQADESRDLQQQRGIYGIFRTIFLKRLESSVASIRISLESYAKKLDIFAQGISEGKIVKLKFMSRFWGNFDPEMDDLEDYLEEEGFELINPEDYKIDAMNADIEKDRQLIALLLELLSELEKQDAKLDAFLDLLKAQGGKKVLIFSYFSDTISYLKRVLPERSKGLITEENSFFLSSQNRGNAEEAVQRFAPKAQEAELKEGERELQYLFATDVLSEGQNLQDAGVLINYDLHWNPVRMIQRNGRINRLGSEHTEVAVYNMSPEVKLESYLNLVKRLEGKIDLIRFTIGTDQSVLGETAKPIDYIESIADIYSDDEQKSLAALQKLEIAGDFLLAEDIFIKDLEEFFENPTFSDRYKKSIVGTEEDGIVFGGIPNGKWGVFPKGKEGVIQPDILSLNRITFRRENGEEHDHHHFLQMGKDGMGKILIPTIKALSLLRTSPEENERVPDVLPLEKPFFLTAAQDLQSYSSLFTTEGGNPKKVQKTILDRMQELGYDFEDIASVRDCIETKNVLDKKEIFKQMATLSRKIQQSEAHNDELEDLIRFARQVLSQKEAPAEPIGVKSILFYAQRI